MNRIGIKSVVLLSLTCIAINAFAMIVPESDVRKAAEAFVSTDPIGSSVLSGRTIANVSTRDMLWIVALAPNGHIIFGGSDLVDPIVGFSKNDFAEPDPGSPAFAVLEGADSSVTALEAQGGGTRHERWTKLLGGGMAKKGLLRADNPSSGAVVVEPFLTGRFDQCQPYNDYAPVHNPAEVATPYRGRCPCGCVATAAAHIFHHFKWPARIDGTISHTQNVLRDNSGAFIDFPIRFNGHVPIDWSAISSIYSSYSGGYDLRGSVAESVRYPIARLILWCDVLAQMEFWFGGSGATYDTIAGNVSDWYTPGHWVEVGANADYSQVFSDLQAGVPLQVGLDGHQVVAHGLAFDGSSTYIYLNFGWSGRDDGYYNLDNSTIDLQMQEIFVGHYPRAKPQIDPLPKVCGTSLALNWHFPDLYTNKLSGFTVSLKKTVTETSTFREDFSAPNGIMSGDSGIFKVGAHSKGYDGNLLYCVSSYLDSTGEYVTMNSSYYTFPAIYTLTSASVLTFRIRSCYAFNNNLELQARFNGGEWTTIMSPYLSEYDDDSGWGTERLYLGNHGGETIQLRFYKAYVDGACYPEQDCILIDDVVLTDVLAQGSAVTRDVSASARSCAFAGLDAGSACTFTVTPIVSGTLAPAETSAPVATSIEGVRRTPVPGAQSYSSQNLVFSTSDTSGVWSHSYDDYGSVVDSSSVKGIFYCTITAKLPGEISETSTLSFQWSASNYQNSGANSWSAIFIDGSGNEITIGSGSSSSDVSRRSVNLPLAEFKGQSGTIRISYSHSGSAWVNSAGVLYAPMVTNVLVPSVPAVAWDTETLVARGTPEILSVSDVSESAMSEGLYGECGTNTTIFSVVCSDTVEMLEARSSHLSLVSDNDVTVATEGNGVFKVYLTPSGINESNFRSRMILTLVGTDSNGTKCYKDLSLRFSQVELAPTEVHVTATTSSGGEFSVAIPHSWLEEKGLVASGSDAAAYETALVPTADADSDGLPNWAEYVCGTDPSDADDKLTVSITMVDGEPVVTYTPDDGRIAIGFKAVIKGTTNLAAALSTWEVVTDTRTSTCRFFSVEIVPED